ncbi:MAG: tRNA 2-thiouridine(34) synthase MnmA [Phycisphaerales bacterium]|nr:tRNA 2-thiouridine(34) synthase MnmA [Phycisphaerales bacterium]
MSGGVDSSVAAALLLRDGYDVVGCFMRLGSPGETLDQPQLDETPQTCKPLRIGKQGCCSINDAADARLVAAKLNIPFYVCNFKKDFSRIIDYFTSEYADGRTPNPCVRCNDWLKFGKLHDYAQQLGCDFVASGHYARIDRTDPNHPKLLRGLDLDKDQSYVLFGVPRDRLNHMLLPIGNLRKPHVREIARELNLPVFDKPDSQEICFVPDNDYAGFIERRDESLANQQGDLIDTSGNRVGTHKGHHRFTIGQRRGIGVALGYPVYVVNKDPRTNTVTLGPRELLDSAACTVGEANWLIDNPAQTLRDWTPCYVQHRSNSDPVPASVRVIADRPDDQTATHSGRRGRFEVRFEKPQDAVTPGQALVVYNKLKGTHAEADPASTNDETPCHLLGGGWIESAH